MIEAMLILLSFSAVTSVYEIAKTGKTSNSSKIHSTAEKIGKLKI